MSSPPPPAPPVSLVGGRLGAEQAGGGEAPLPSEPVERSSEKGAPLGVIAGGGALPRLVAEAEARAGGAAFIVGLRGFVDPWIADWPHRTCGVGQPGGIFAALRAAGCRRVCFAGGLSRPSFRTLFTTLRFDVTGLRIAPRIARLLRQGDDGLLRGLAEIFEAEGFTLVAAQELLGELLAPPGPLGSVSPSAADLQDIRRAASVVDALGAVDVGQGAIVAQGRCLGVETVFGTDAMLGDVAARPRRHGAAIPSGALFKAPKPGQDQRLDLPAIGPRTIEAVRAARLNGVAVAAGAVFVLEPDATVAAADAAGLFVYGWTPSDG